MTHIRKLLATLIGIIFLIAISPAIIMASLGFGFACLLGWAYQELRA